MPTLHDLPKEERPRERLVKYGVEVLSLQELLALIFGKGTKGEPVMTISQKLLSKFGSLEKISEASIEDLKTVKGIGLAKACKLKACFEIARRLVIKNIPPRTSFGRNDKLGPKEIYKEIGRASCRERV